MNLIQSLIWFFFRYFLVRYLRYFPENLVEATTTTLESPSWETVISSPRLPVWLSTLMCSTRYLTYEAGSKTPFSVGAEQSTVKVLVAEALFA